MQTETENGATAVSEQLRRLRHDTVTVKMGWKDNGSVTVNLISSGGKRVTAELDRYEAIRLIGDLAAALR